ncbi:MAG: hypothetical protein ACUZ8E_12715 [Candidatus Anammoxibacter sp.]
MVHLAEHTATARSRQENSKFSTNLMSDKNWIPTGFAIFALTPERMYSVAFHTKQSGRLEMALMANRISI